MLKGEEMRYQDAGQTVEGKIRKAETPYVLVETRDPVSGEKKQDMLDLRFLDHPELKVQDRTWKIVGIVGGSTAGAIAVGVVVGVIVNGFVQIGHALHEIH